MYQSIKINDKLVIRKNSHYLFIESADYNAKVLIAENVAIMYLLFKFFSLRLNYFIVKLFYNSKVKELKILLV